MSKKELIEKGENVSLDGVTVLNNVFVAEKAEKKVETKDPDIEKTEETPSSAENEAPVESQTVPSIEIPSVEIPAAPVVEPTVIEQPQVEIPVAPIDLSGIVSNDSTDPTVYPEIPSTNINVPFENNSFNSLENNPVNSFESSPVSYSNNEDYPNDFSNTNFNSSSFNNFMNNYDNNVKENKVPDGIDKALEMVRNEVLKVTKENGDFKGENIRLKGENNELNRQLSEQAAQITILRNKIAGMQNSMAAAQSRILDVFGMNMAGNVAGQNTNFGDDQINNNIGGMAA